MLPRHLAKMYAMFMIAIVAFGCATADSFKEKYYNDPDKMHDIPELMPLSRGLDTYLFELGNGTRKRPEFFVSDLGVVHVFQPAYSRSRDSNKAYFGHFQIGTAAGDFDRETVNENERAVLTSRLYGVRVVVIQHDEYAFSHRSNGRYGMYRDSTLRRYYSLDPPFYALNVYSEGKYSAGDGERNYLKPFHETDLQVTVFRDSMQMLSLLNDIVRREIFWNTSVAAFEEILGSMPKDDPRVIEFKNIFSAIQEDKQAYLASNLRASAGESSLNYFLRGIGEIIERATSYAQEHPFQAAVALWAGKMIVDGMRADDGAPHSVVSDNVLAVAVEKGQFLPTTVTKFKVQALGDQATGFARAEDSSGNGFLQTGYANLYLLPSGTYRLTFTGLDESGNEYFKQIIPSYEYPGDRVYCRLNISTQLLSCR